MKEKLKTILFKLGLDNVIRYIYRLFFWRKRLFIKYPPYGKKKHNYVISRLDPIRYEAIALALHRIEKDKIFGSIAELGVYRGETSKFLKRLCSNKKIILFDTFEGFPEKDLEVDKDYRFNNTSLEYVKNNISDIRNIEFRVGYFPESAKGLEHEKFCFVLIDMDLYKPTLEGLNFFYPKVSRGGYLFVHDYNSPESNYAVSKAVNKFMQDKPELIVEIPDVWGTIMFRKI